MSFKINLFKILLSFAFFLAFVPALKAQKSSAFKLAGLFTDHIVLQRQMQVPVWGKGQPGKTVTVRFNGQKITATVDAKGNWQAALAPMKAGGPFTLIVKSGAQTIQLKDVLIGEVWLCSGQSNMEMPVKGWPPGAPVLHSQQEIKAANFPEIRLFTVPKTIAIKPVNRVKSQWQICSPQTVADFSATAYFFGKKLYQKLHVPIGLIHSSWGGTPAEAWVSAECLKRMPEFKKPLEELKNIIPQTKKLKTWLARLKSIDLSTQNWQTFWEKTDFGDQRFAAPKFDDYSWPKMQLPTNWERTEVGQFDGAVWFRKKITIPKSWQGKTLQLSLGPIDDMDRVYFNGQKIGGHEQLGLWQLKRSYPLPEKLVRAGENVIAVLVIDTQGGGGIYGHAQDLKLYWKTSPDQSMALAGSWRYLPVAEIRGQTLFLFAQGENSYFHRPKLPLAFGPNTPTLLYNGMISPLIPFALRGVIWYQGESNVGRAEQYATLFPLLINCWRDHWQEGDFPFYFVQIAPFDYGAGGRAQFLREAQLKTLLKVKNSGMVVTTDIGNPQNIHPANKQAVGNRLARWALAKTYGRKNVVFSGPLYKSMKKEGNTSRLHFDYVRSGLVAKGGKLIGFTIAGNDHKFYPAQAKIEGKTVVVWSSKVANPKAVRFGWSNTAQPNLFNKEGLPASPFRTDNWPEEEN